MSRGPRRFQETYPGLGHLAPMLCRLHGSSHRYRTGQGLYSPYLHIIMTTIAKASIKYTWPSWIVYDQNFRQEAADNGVKDWSNVDPSIYTQCFTNAAASRESWCQLCQSFDHGSDACPIRGHSNLGNQLGPRKRLGDALSQPAKKRPPPHSNPQACRCVQWRLQIWGSTYIPT